MTGLQQTNKVVEISWWFAAVGLTAVPKPVSLLLLFPEDFRGEPVTGNISIWALEGFPLTARRGGSLAKSSILSVHSLGLINVGLWACSPMLQAPGEISV